MVIDKIINFGKGLSKKTNKPQNLNYLKNSAVKIETKSKSAQEMKQKIIDAAIDVFFTKGVVKASLAEIALKAGATRGAIYWHFKNKNDVFEALFEKLYQPLTEMILEDMKINDHEPLLQLKNLCIQCLKNLAFDPVRQKILTIFLCKCDYSGMDEILEKQKQKKLQNIEYFSNYFDRARKLGFIKSDVPSRDLAISLICYLCGITSEYLRSGIFDLEKQAKPLMEQFFASFNEFRK